MELYYFAAMETPLLWMEPAFGGKISYFRASETHLTVSHCTGSIKGYKETRLSKAWQDLRPGTAGVGGYGSNAQSILPAG